MFTLVETTTFFKIFDGLAKINDFNHNNDCPIFHFGPLIK